MEETRTWPGTTGRRLTNANESGEVAKIVDLGIGCAAKRTGSASSQDRRAASFGGDAATAEMVEGKEAIRRGGGDWRDRLRRRWRCVAAAVVGSFAAEEEENKGSRRLLLLIRKLVLAKEHAAAERRMRWRCC